jgi:hypothetical protein
MLDKIIELLEAIRDRRLNMKEGAYIRGWKKRKEAIEYDRRWWENKRLGIR